jgi:hypothetical protein
MSIIIFSYHFCFLYDGKLDEGLKLKMIVNSSFKFAKLEIRV